MKDKLIKMMKKSDEVNMRRSYRRTYNGLKDEMIQKQEL